MRCVLTLLTVLLIGLPAARADENPADSNPVAKPRATDTVISSEAVHAAIRRALPPLREEGDQWMRGKIDMQDNKACVSCHYVSFGVWAGREAAAAGDSDLQQAFSDLNHRAIEFVDQPGKGRAVTFGTLLLINPNPNPADAETLSSWWKDLRELQKPDGRWRAAGQFPTQSRPIAESDAVATMWVLAAIAANPAPDRQTTAARDKAIRWLRNSSPGKTNEWLAWRLMISSTIGDSSEETRQFAHQLLTQQNEDGSFSWLPGIPADAVATGQSLMALLTPLPGETATQNRNTAVERAVRFLLKTQQSDGRWEVLSDHISKSPDSNKDQIYTYWGTAWATIGLARYARSTTIAAADSGLDDSR